MCKIKHSTLFVPLSLLLTPCEKRAITLPLPKRWWWQQKLFASNNNLMCCCFSCRLEYVWHSMWIDEQRANILPKSILSCLQRFGFVVDLFRNLHRFADDDWETKRKREDWRTRKWERESTECCSMQCLDDNREIVLQFSGIPSNQIMALNFWHGIYARQFKKPPHIHTHI